MEDKVVVEAKSFIDFYKSGFLDGVNYEWQYKMQERTVWDKIKHDCEKAVKKRYRKQSKKGMEDSQQRQVKSK